MKKIIKRLLLFFLSLCLVCFLYMRIGAYVFLDSEIRKEVVERIKDSPPLPERFYELYEVVYPKSFSTSFTENLIRETLMRETAVREVPSYDAAYHAILYVKLNRPQAIYYIEDQIAQRECLNFVAQQSDFLYNNIGIRQASKHYFEKELEELDDREMVTLIVMMKNPSLYNPIRRPEMVKEAVDKVMERLKEPSK